MGIYFFLSNWSRGKGHWSESVACGNIILNFMILIFMGKHTCSASKNRTYIIGTRPLRIYPWMSLLRFCDYGLVRIVRDLTVKKYLNAGLTFPMIYLLIILFYPQCPRAQTWYPFGPATRARALIFNLSRSDIYEEILRFNF